MSPLFLTVEDVLELHALQRARYGGPPGLRERGLLESAIAQPMATFSGEFIHSELRTMAAAYLFHLVSNHPFVDGNKRIGLLSALVFLDLNGVPLLGSSKALYALTMEVAEGRVDKDTVGARFQMLLEEARG